MRPIGTKLRSLAILSALVSFVPASSTSAEAALTETYTGFQTVSDGERFHFGFDFWYDNFATEVKSDSALIVPPELDAHGGSSSWASATLTVDLFADDPGTAETAQIRFEPWNLSGDPAASYLVGYFVFDPAPGLPHTFIYTLDPQQVDLFSLTGWGDVIVSAPELEGMENDFAIAGVSFEVRPVPLPASILLFGGGLTGLAALRRRGFRRR